MSNSAAPWTAVHQAPLSSTISQSLLKFMSFGSLMLSNHLILCCPLVFLPSVFPRIKVFYNKSALHLRWSKYQSFSFSNSPSNEYSGLISFRINWFDLLVVQRTLKSLLCSLILLCPWDFPVNNTGVGCHFLLQGIIPIFIERTETDAEATIL